MTIRVLIADDHAMVRSGLLALLNGEHGIEVAGAAGDGEEAVRLALQERPDVILMDFFMPKMDGVQAMREIRDKWPDACVVMLTSSSDYERILQAIDGGAAGYILKDSSSEELIRSVRAAASGQAPLDPKVARALLDARRFQPAATVLTAREEEILDCLVRGMANKEISARLGIREKTVKSHLTNLFQRIGVADRTQAALWAQRRSTHRDEQ